MKRSSLVLLAALFLAGAARGQIVQGGDFVTVGFGSNVLYRVTPAGAVTTILAGPPLSGPSGVAVTPTREILVADFTSGTLLRLSTAGAVTPVVSGLAGPIRVAVDRNGDYVVTELNTDSLLRVTPAGAVTTIHSGPPFVHPIGVAVDGNGDFLVADDFADALFRVTPAGSVTTIHQGIPFQLPEGVALFANGDYAVIDGIADSVFRVPRLGGPVTTLVPSPPMGNPCGIVSDFEGGFVVSESGAPAGDRVLLVDSTGAASVVAQGAPFSNLETVARVPRLAGPSVVTPGLAHVFDLDFPGEGGLPYAMFACLSLFPGIPLPPPDPRGTPCNPDPILFFTIGLNDPVFVGWGGTLSPAGQALPSLNVPPVPLPVGLVLFLQVLTLDPGSPNGLRSLSDVHPLVL
jgi:hypothetical protein